MEAIIVALITGGLSLAGSLLAHNKTKSLILYRLEQLEKKQDKHNGLMERMAVVEQSTKSAHHRIDDVEERI